MNTPEQNLIIAKDYILKLLKGDFTGLSEPYEGLCDNLSQCTGVRMHCEYFAYYPDYSGDKGFPFTVKDPCGESPSDIYCHYSETVLMWEGSDYATERLKFCRWVYNHITVEWIY